MSGNLLKAPLKYICRVYSNCCCRCSFEPEMIKIGQLSQGMYSNNILNFQESTKISNACTKMSGNLLKAPLIYISRVYFNCSCRCSFEPEIIKMGQSSHKIYSNNIVNFQESTTILNACTKKKSGNLLKVLRIYLSIYLSIYLRMFISIYQCMLFSLDLSIYLSLLVCSL